MLVGTMSNRGRRLKAGLNAQARIFAQYPCKKVNFCPFDTL
jgi:hypothetical protein